MKPGQPPAAKVARTVFHGSYESLGAAWGEFRTWIQAQGHTPATELWKVYVTGPDAKPDPAPWRTQLNGPRVG